jgi:hypothetical protein
MFMGFFNSNKTHRNKKENQNSPPHFKYNIVFNVEIKEKE